MSYHQALKQARETLATEALALPSFAAVEAALRWQAGEARPGKLRRFVASGGAILACGTMAVDGAISLQWGAPILFTLVIPVLFLAASAVLIHRPRFSAQLFARALWWSYLLFGVIWSAGPVQSLPVAGSLLSAGCGAALLAAGRRGVTRADTRARFDPVALRGGLLAAMIVGLADAQLLGLMGAASAEAGQGPGKSLALGALALAMLVGAWGLSRLRTWAVALNVVLSVAAFAVLSVLSNGESPLLPLLAIGVGVQGLLPIRIALARRGLLRAGGGLPAWPAAAAVIVLAVAAILTGMLRSLGL